MTITKNDFFTANNFKTLQDISKKYPEWKDFCMEIVNQMDDKFGQTKAETKQLWFIDYTMADSLQLPGLSASELQKDRLYLYKVHAVKNSTGITVKSKELYDTGVNIAQMPPYIKGDDIFYGDERRSIINLQTDDYTYNVGDTLISLGTILKNDDDTERMDYNGALYEVVNVQDKKTIYLITKDKVSTPFKKAQTLYLYNRAK